MNRAVNKASVTPRGLQTVFRVKSLKARDKVVANVEEQPKSSFNARRSHKKSRSGCQNCKLRRVKCDETKDGGCWKCRRHGIDCDYLTTSMPDVQNSSSGDNSPLIIPEHNNLDTSSVAQTPRTTDMITLRPSLRQPTPLQFDLPTDITLYLETLRHFEFYTCPTITSPDGQKIFETSVLAIANQKDYLMHAVLGTAAAHLAWKANKREDVIQQRQHRQAEAYHWSRALSMFRTKLDTLSHRSDETVDALISTCMLLGIHSYFLSGEAEEVSFVWKRVNERPEALRWLSVQSGFGLLLRSLGGRAALSVWLDVFNSVAPREAGFSENISTAQGIYKDLLDVCAIDEHSTPDNNPYLLPVRDLFGLLQMGSPNMTSFAPLMAIMGRLVGPFQDLLVKRDAAAMLVVAYWLALMQELQLWWIQDRARRECTAIVTFLKINKDPLIRRLLEFPARAMAIDLNSS